MTEELRLELTVNWKKVGVRCLMSELRLEFMMENPHLTGDFDRVTFTYKQSEL